jgi:helicase
MFTRNPSATQKGISMHSDSNADQLAFEVDGVPTPNGTSVPSASTITEPSAPPSSSASALDALLNEYRARATSEREKGTLFGRIVKKVGSSLYWDDWSKDIATVAGRYIRLIEQLLEDPERQDAFQEFVARCARP